MHALHRPLHQSWLFAAFFFGITAGVIVSLQLGTLYFLSPAWLFCGGLLAALGLWRRQAWLLLMLFAAGGMVGLWRGSVYREQLLPYAKLQGQVVTIKGKITDDPDNGENGETVLRLGSIVIAEHSLKGDIWVSAVGKIPTLKRGDSVIVKGKLAPGFGSFAGSIYRAGVIRAERPVPGDVALRVRDWFSDGIRRAIPEPEASLGVGYLVGERRSLPEELDKALRAAGLTHIVVASGYNLTILVSIARRLFVKISKFLATFFSAGMIVAFIAITGASPSMSRAGLVTGLSLLAWQYGRRFHPLVLLPFVAAFTLLISPEYGQSDLGWQLSFASFAGVLIVGPLMQNYFFGDEKPSVPRQVLFETLSAWLCTVPLIVLAFGQFSNVAIIANLLVLPLVPLAMLLTFIAGIVAIIIPPLAVAAGFPAFIVLGYMTKTASYLGNLPWAQTELTISAYGGIAYYAVLILICGYLWCKTKFNFVERISPKE